MWVTGTSSIVHLSWFVQKTPWNSAVTPKLHQLAISQKLITCLWWRRWLREKQRKGQDTNERKPPRNTLPVCSCKTSQRERRRERRDLGARKWCPCFSFLQANTASCSNKLSTITSACLCNVFLLWKQSGTGGDGGSSIHSNVWQVFWFTGMLFQRQRHNFQTSAS